jgi:two-component system, NarL family, sensor histidine kinase DesK
MRRAGGDKCHGSTLSRVSALPSSSRATLLARGVTATWWYTASSIVFFLVIALGLWALPGWAVREPQERPAFAVVYAAAAAVSVVSAVLLLREYRRARFLQSERDLPAWSRPGLLAGVAAGSLSAGVLGYLAGVLLAAGLVAFSLSILAWPHGVRLRFTVLVTALLGALWWVEAAMLQPIAGATLPHPFFAVALAPMTVLTLWWWDIVVELDRARAAEGSLAAAQERLRLANDLHDLQGHHLQVIALQLELAERTLTADPDAAREHVRSAQRSVDDARAGTRDLATRFRGVPLPDELANAADLLRAAGLRVDLAVAAGAEVAPADLLGPVVRESTTNVLKHGAGGWARLELDRGPAGWRLAVANDAARLADDADAAAGNGLAGIVERVGEVGGEARWERRPDRFELTVTVPVSREVAR